MTDQTIQQSVEPTSIQITQLEEKLNLRKQLQDITNRINAAQNLKQILVDLRDDVLNLFDAHSITIYVTNRKKNEIYSMFLAGSELKQIRLQINNKSIAGYVANNKKAANISDAYRDEELKKIDKELNFDSSWDKKSGFRTTQVLAVPIQHENNIMGVVQILNKESGGQFTSEDQGFLEEIADVLGIAFINQERISKKRRTRFSCLISHGIIKEEDLEKAIEEAQKNRQTTEDYLMKEMKVSKEAIGNSLEEFYNCRFIQFSDKQPVPFELIKNLKEEYLRRELWVPLEKKDGKIRIIIDDPNNIIKRDMIENLLNARNVDYDVALYEDIIKYINHFYQTGGGDTSISDIIGKMDIDVDEFEEADEYSESDSIIMQLVNRVINDAYNRNASDIHIEPNVAKKNVEVRYRVDGALMIYQSVPFSYRSAMVSRIKIMSNLDITERRIPQDGKIKFRRPRGDEIELRVATIPTQGGIEDVVMRILAKGETMPLEDMGISKRNYECMVDILAKPYGMVLVVGPTGSGKTTTLHAALHHINTPDTKIWTAEDPVEITQYGLRQVQINPKIGFDFAAAMRAFLRADPDVIMVGEMRDYETAKTGVEASLTGHLVFSTLHTNSAPETIVRLLDMGIDPLNFADSLLGILAQRLVRTLCKSCKEEYHPTKEEYDELAHSYGEEQFAKLNIPYTDNLKLLRAKGCAKCENTGYKGRMGIHELIVATDEIKRLIQQHASVEQLRDEAMTEGMTTLLQDGIDKCLKGYTDFSQVRRVCIK
ncbi:MAG: Flp pilus assembly complex ATPase component TadA [Syntrophaceae bacterium]|nr:Flp pilus assembly complex ATPase component TadA [Syntrophaceae bacterium]